VLLKYFEDTCRIVHSSPIFIYVFFTHVLFKYYLLFNAECYMQCYITSTLTVQLFSDVDITK